MNDFKGKAIYNPSGKAGEYSYWACNFYVGCSNECAYCYLKKGRGAKVLGGNVPTLKKCFKNEAHALDVFTAELHKNIEDLKKHGLFFSFSTDPMLSETIRLTLEATKYAVNFGVPVKILTKTGLLAFKMFNDDVTFYTGLDKSMVAFGVTLTGDDESELNAKSNAERIETLLMAKKFGYKTFVSFEPMFSDWYVLDILRKYHSSIDMAKIGLESGSGKIKYMHEFIEDVLQIECMRTKIYLKDSLIKMANLKREQLWGNAVERDYNLFSKPV